MSFTGFSSDQEGSIIYDGEKFIINNPSKAPENFNPGGKPVVGLPEDHPSRLQNRPQSTTTTPPGADSPSKSQSDSGSDKADKKKKPQKPTASQPSTSGFPQDIEWEPDISAFGQVTFIPTAAEEIRDIGEDGQLQPDTLPESVAPAWQGNTPLTLGQAQHVDHLLTVETDHLAREALITMKREGAPPRSQWKDFMAQYALWSWDSESDALAWATLATIAESDWDEWLGHADTPLVETIAQDQANDWIEGLVVINAETGDILLDVTGVVRADGSQYVGLQDTDVEALKGLELVFVHNHTEEVGASDEDLESAFDAGAEVLIVITPSGREQVYLRGRGRMVKVRDEQASYEVGPENPEETEELRTKSEEQAAAYLADSPEFMFLQSDPEVIANMDVNPADVPRYKDLETFVNTSLAELQHLAVENPMIIDENIELLKNVFGYEVAFYGVDVPLAEYYKEASIEYKRSAMEQVHNLATILFHFLNDLGMEIMQSTPEETRYILWADERIRELHNVEDYAFRGHVALPESNAKENPDLKIVYLGSEIEAGAIGHEVAHEIDRRAGEWSSVSEGDQPPPVGSLEWFLWNKVTNRLQPTSQHGYNFKMAAGYLNPGSRAARKEDRDSDREIFADILPAKILGPLDEEYFSRVDTDAAIGFKVTNNAKDTACGIEQYYDQYAKYLEYGTPEPKDFVYDPELCE